MSGETLDASILKIVRPYFDETFYTRDKPEMRGIDDALVHFMEVGWKEGRDPNSDFSTIGYLDLNPSLRERGVNPLVHWVLFGKGHNEGSPSSLQNKQAERLDINDPLIGLLFDEPWYLAQLERSLIEADALSDYLAYGQYEGLSPHPCFDAPFYAEAYASDIEDTAPFVHFVTKGLILGFDPHPLFDTDYVRSQMPAGDTLPPFLFYLMYTGADAPDPHPLFSTQLFFAETEAPETANGLALYQSDPDLAEVSPSHYFDAIFYVESLGDESLNGSTPLQHYLWRGWQASLSPHPVISTEWLLRNQPRQAQYEPVGHWLRSGRQGVLSPVFDPDYYAQTADDLHEVDVIEHFLANGWKEGRAAHPIFREEHYLAQQPDVPKAVGEGVRHYVQYGWKEKRSFSPCFDALWYASQSKAQSSDEFDLVSDYISTGWRKGFSPHPVFDPDYYSDQLDMPLADLNPLTHFLDKGHMEGLSPHIIFDGEWYGFGLLNRETEIPLWVHFVAIGDGLGYSCHPLFDVRFYKSLYPGSLQHRNGPLTHYLCEGIKKQYNPHPVLNIDYMAMILQDDALRESGLPGYLRLPISDRRHPHPLFDAFAVAQTFPLEEGCDALIEYVKFRSNTRLDAPNPQSNGAPRPMRAFTPRPVASTGLNMDTKFSILVPTYNSDQGHFSRMIESVIAQDYENWELVIVDDGSSIRAPRMCAWEFAKKEPRINAYALSKNSGISNATNYALGKATGKYVVMLDHDDVLAPTTLSLLAERFGATDADVVYTDQAYVSAEGEMVRTFFKPAWSPKFMAGIMYVGHLLAVRKALAEEVGGFDSQFDRLQDFEFMLRIGERTRLIEHVADITYHWRQVPGSIAGNASAKGDISTLQAKAVNAHFERLNRPRSAHPHPTCAHRVKISPNFQKIERPPTTILVTSEKMAETVSKACGKDDVQLVEDTRGGTSPSMVETLNWAVKNCSAETIIYLSEGATVSGRDWADYLNMYLAEENIGLVGLNAQSTSEAIIAAGTVLGGKNLYPAMAGLDAASDGHAGSLLCDREVVGVYGHAVGFNRETFISLGSLDTDYRDPVFALCDLSLRAFAKGFQNVAVSGKRVVVDQSGLASFKASSVDRFLLDRNAAVHGVVHDPFFNQNFDGDPSFGCESVET